MMGRIPKVAHVDEPHEDADDRDNLCEHVPKVVQLAFQRGLLADLGRNGLVDVTDRRILAREDDDCARGPIYNRRSLVTVDITMERDLVVEKRERTVNSMFIMSCLTALTSETTSVDLLTLTLSPVRMAWSTRKLLDDTERSLQSAGILSPTATEMMSPGTIFDAGMRLSLPERSTFASSGEYCIKA